MTVDELNDFYDPELKRANVAPHLARDDFRLVVADVADREAMSRLFAETRPDAIVHLAARAGVTKNQVQLIEAGRASGRADAVGPSNPRMATLAGLAEALSIDVSELLAEAGL